MKLKHLFQKIGIKVVKTFGNPDAIGSQMSTYAVEATSICKRLISKEDTVLLLSPISGKRYIRSKDNQIHVIIEGHLVTIVNHSYSYVIPMEGKSHERLIRMFDMEVEARRNVMEAEIRANIKHSLSNIYENLVNEQV